MLNLLNLGPASPFRALLLLILGLGKKCKIGAIFALEFAELKNLSLFCIIYLNNNKDKTMLGFGTNSGVEIKGRFADEMRATMKRLRSGRLNDKDKEALRFQQESGVQLETE